MDELFGIVKSTQSRASGSITVEDVKKAVSDNLRTKGYKTIPSWVNQMMYDGKVVSKQIGKKTL